MQLVSIIVPVYNSEKYLKESIDSILKQSFSNFELLLINDGSTDNSAEICDFYTAKDSRIKIFHKSNGGVSSARNLGLKNAFGKYICFVDSDDTINTNFLLDLITDLENVSAQLVIQNLKKFDTEGKIGDLYKYQNQLLDVKGFLNNFNITVYGFVAGKLYLNEIVKERQITFDEEISFGEDCKFMLEYLYHCQGVYMSTKSNYNYRIVNSGLTNKQLNYENEYKCFIKIKDSIERLSQKNKIAPNNQIIFYSKRLLNSIFVDKNLKTSISRVEKLQYLFKHHTKEILEIYKKSRFRGFLFYLLLKHQQLFLFEIVYRKVR